jgi:riboflavin kinase/FMN adenylyltransferase
MNGRVQHGARRGRLLGFPTANLLRPPRDVADGVYAAWVGIDRERAVRPALASLGRSPTFGVRARRLEVHLIDFEGDLYGRRLRVVLRARLASQRRCASPAALGRRIAALVRQARRVLRDGDVP